MGKENKILRYLKDPRYRFLVNAAIGFYNNMQDEKYIRYKYFALNGVWLDLDKPRTYNEKLNWLKIHYRNEMFPILADKHLVKNYIKEKIGEKYLIPSLGVWDSFDEIDFSKLPDQFVLKCTHDSGGLVICKDKRNFDIRKARKKINRSLRNNYYYIGREWHYNDIKPRILAEAYMEDSKTAELRDYKFFCFDGVVKAMFVAADRQSRKPTTFDFFDTDFNHIDVRQGHPNAVVCPEKPQHFELMKELAEKLSQGIPHVRVDFYEVNGAVYFGEMTFFHFDGMTVFDPPEWDLTFGSWLKLPEKNA